MRPSIVRFRALLSREENERYLWGREMKALLILALLLPALPSRAYSADQALEHLSRVTIFAFGGIGYAGVISPGERDFKIILSRPSALADFEKLYAQGNLQAKCYALAGIRRLNPTRFAEIVQTLRGSKEKVVTMEGCIISDKILPAIITQIESGELDRWLRKDAAASQSSPKSGSGKTH